MLDYSKITKGDTKILEFKYYIWMETMRPGDILITPEGYAFIFVNLVTLRDIPGTQERSALVRATFDGLDKGDLS